MESQYLAPGGRRGDVWNGEWVTDRSELIEQLCGDSADVDLADCIIKLRRVVPHRFFAYGVFRTVDGRVERIVNVDFPVAHLRSIRLSENSGCKVICQWLIKREPLLVSGPLDGECRYAAEISAATMADVDALLIHAQLDLAGSRAIAFFLGDVPAASFEAASRELRVLTPYLYVAAVRSMRALTSPKSRYSTADPLTPREIEVLTWVYHGKTNEEIGKILSISVFTVKNHIQRILLKLNATNRVQAVLRAAEAGLFHNGRVP